MLPERPGVEHGPFVRSPEQVALELAVAGPTSRMLAYLIDYGVMLSVVAVLMAAMVIAVPALLWGLTSSLGEVPDLLEKLLGETAQVLVAILMIFTLFAVEALYFVFWEAVLTGRSPGKVVVRLRVVRDGGLPITLGPSLVRNLLRVVDALPVSYVVGLIAMVASPSGKRLGDMAAGTLVIRLDRPPAVGAVAATPEAAVHAFRFDRLQAARLGRDEATLARETLRRLDALEPEQRAHLLATATAALVARLGYAAVPPEQQQAFLHAVLEATKLR